MPYVKKGIMKAQELVEKIIKIADDKKADNITSINIAKKSSLADYMLILEGNSDRQVRMLADEIIETLKQENIRPLHDEGMNEKEWIVLDYGDVIVHIFQPEARQTYRLEELWSTKRKPKKVAETE